MTLGDFARFLDLNPAVRDIELSNWGEIFLNPDLKSMIRLAYERKVRLSCGNGTNFNDVDDDVLEALVRYRFHYLNISIDGVSQAVYSTYRRNGNVDRVFANIRKLNEYKRKLGSEFPKLSWQFIVFGHNEHEIRQARELSASLGMRFNPKLNHTPGYSPVRDPDRVRRESGMSFVRRDEYEVMTGRRYKHPCYQCFFSPQVNWNGILLGCCVNKWGGFGNAFEHSLSEILCSTPYRNLERFLSAQDDVDSLPCASCPNRLALKHFPLTHEGLVAYASYVHPALKD